jgi:hypothetical protein
VAQQTFARLIRPARRAFLVQWKTKGGKATALVEPSPLAIPCRSTLSHLQRSRSRQLRRTTMWFALGPFSSVLGAGQTVKCSFEFTALGTGRAMARRLTQTSWDNTQTRGSNRGAGRIRGNELRVWRMVVSLGGRFRRMCAYDSQFWGRLCKTQSHSSARIVLGLVRRARLRRGGIL